MAARPQAGWTERHEALAKTAGYDSWERWIQALEAELGHQVCGAMKRQAPQAPCPNRPSVNGRCRHHGAKSPKGAASGLFKHGRYSTFLPTALADDYAQTFNDPEYMSLRNAIAINEARQIALIRRLQTGETAAAWSALSARTSRLVDAVVGGNGEEVMRLAQEIDAICAASYQTEVGWKELRAEQHHGKLLREAESRIKRDREMSLDKDRAIALMTWIFSLLRDKVQDPAVLSSIGSDIRAKLTDRKDNLPVIPDSKLH